MLKTMRRHAKYFYVLFLIVIVSFIFWGVGSRQLDGGKHTEAVATIGKDKITLADYWRTYERAEDAMRQVYGAKFDDNMKKELKQKVLDELVTEAVLYRAARNAGLTVTDKELSDSIMADPNFARNNVFDRQVYLRTLEFNRLTPSEYESMKRRQLLLNKMRRLIEDPVELSPAENARIPSGDEKAAQMVKEAVLGAKKERVLDSYIRSLEGHIKVTENPDLIS